MNYINQLNYKEMPYLTNLECPDSVLARKGTVSRAGCGLCCACMLVEGLTLEQLSLEDCRELSVRSGANQKAGTSMEILAPALAERFGLSYRPANSTQELLDCLQNGGQAIINVGGDRDGHTGVFSHHGHFILAVSTDRSEVCILDPSYKEHKYEEPGREGKVRVEGLFAYTAPAVLEQDTASRNPAYYLFSRH